MAFLNVNLNKNYYFFNETIPNTIRNFIPYEIVTCDDNDPPYMTRPIKNAISH